MTNTVSPSRSGIADFLLVSRAHSYAYVFVPKAACSTAKVALWRAERELSSSVGFLEAPMAVHARQYHADAPWLSRIDTDFHAAVDDKFSRGIFLFSIARNPYSRIFSAYHNKILGVEKGVDQHDYLGEIGWQKSAPPNFLEFLEILSDRDPSLHNPHWKSITDIICYETFEYDKIYHVEMFFEYFLDISRRVFGDRASRHPANAHVNTTRSEDTKLDAYSDRSIEIVQRLYEKDFDNFGYDLDIRYPLPSRP